VTQTDPWNVKVGLKTNLLIKDKGNLALWNRSAVFEAYIPITNFEDPLYVVETSGLVTNRINQSKYYGNFVSGADYSNLREHFENSYYINSSSGPSFLDRLEGKKTANGYGNGIESLVYTPKLSSQGISVKVKSVVDYIYFNSSVDPVSSLYPAVHSDFRMDDEDNHLSIYQLV